MYMQFQINRKRDRKGLVISDKYRLTTPHHILVKMTIWHME